VRGGAELWIAGNPRMPLEPLEEAARRADGTVRFVPRFVRDTEIPALMRRADIVVLPYREIDQSGVLYAALPFGKPLVLSDVGGFSELAERHGAASLVPPGDPAALAAALNRLLADDAERARLGAAALRAAQGPYSWDSVAEQTLALYRELLARS
jgi:glycosyltransferase involved in cell wall biosynthesis